MFVLGRLCLLRRCLALLLSGVVFHFTRVMAVPGNFCSGSKPVVHKPRPNLKLLLQTAACLIEKVDKVVVVLCWDVIIHGNLQLGGNRGDVPELWGEVGQQGKGYGRDYLCSLQHFGEGVKSCLVIS